MRLVAAARRAAGRSAGRRDRVQGEAGDGCGGDGTGEDVDRFAEGGGAGGEGAGAFAAERAGIETALAGEHEVGGGEAGIEIEPSGDEVEAGDELRGGGRHEAERDAAGRTGAGDVHERVGFRAVGAKQEGEAGGFVVEAAEVGGAKALCGP